MTNPTGRSEMWSLGNEWSHLLQYGTSCLSCLVKPGLGIQGAFLNIRIQKDLLHLEHHA